jgi:hypothetical protein
MRAEIKTLTGNGIRFLRITERSRTTKMKWKLQNPHNVFLNFLMALCHILVLDFTGFDRVAVNSTTVKTTVRFTIGYFLANFLTFVE